MNLLNIDYRNAELDDLIFYVAQADVLIERANENEYPLSESFLEKAKNAKAELNRRLADAKRREIRKIELALEELKTPDEKRKDLLARLAKLQKEI